jgi:hypothetical protein
VGGRLGRSEWRGTASFLQLVTSVADINAVLLLDPLLLPRAVVF